MNDLTKTIEASRVKVDVSDLIEMGHLTGHMRLPRFQIKSHNKGSLLSTYKGRGMELADIRRYQDGDDVRDLNWSMFARTGELHTKLYQEERERPLYLWVDHSSSMQFATRGLYKSVIASKLAALVGWYELKNSNRIGGFKVSDSDSHFIKASKSKKGFMQLLQLLSNQLEVSNDNETLSLEDKLRELNRVKQPGSALYLFSDFRGWNEACEHLILHLSRNQDVMLNMILDPIEVELPNDGVYRFSDGNRQAQIDTANKKSLEPYYREMHQRIDSISRLGSLPNIDSSFALTNDDPIEACFRNLNKESKFLKGEIS